MKTSMTIGMVNLIMALLLTIFLLCMHQMMVRYLTPGGLLTETMAAFSMNEKKTHKKRGSVLLAMEKTGKDMVHHVKTLFWYSYGALVVVLIFLVIMAIVVMTVREDFFFEVSPQRAECLKQQVSRDNFGEQRGCSCCGKGTVGGIPPNYAEWLNIDPDTGSRWHRPDGNTVVITDTFSNGEEAQCKTCNPPSYITYV